MLTGDLLDAGAISRKLGDSVGPLILIYRRRSRRDMLGRCGQRARVLYERGAASEADILLADMALLYQQLRDLDMWIGKPRFRRLWVGILGQGLAEANQPKADDDG